MRALLLLTLIAVPAAAQEAVGLGDLYRRAVTADPRVRQLELEAEQSELRLRNLQAERLPALELAAEAQHQSDVVELPFPPAEGFEPPRPPADTVDVHLDVDQTVIDPTRRAREEGERARLAEAQARVRTAVAALRREVDEAFFTALSLQEREAEVQAVVADLEARLREARLRVEEGLALPSEAMTLEATLLRRTQDADELRARRRAALLRLSALIGMTLAIEDRLRPPVLGDAVEAARESLDAVPGRPELAELARSRERLEAEKALLAARQRPRLSAFARFGYGRPGLDFLNEELDAYWLAGLRLRWSPEDWGVAEREERILELRQEALATEGEVLVRSIRRSIEDDLAIIDHLSGAAAVDERIVALREAIERETRARYEERVVTAADYVDRQTDVLDARLTLAAHRAELARAQASLLTRVGWEVP